MKAKHIGIGALVLVAAIAGTLWVSKAVDARSGNRGANASSENRGYRSSGSSRSEVIPAGTALNVRLDTKLSTEHAQSGDTWTGSVTNAVVVDGRTVIPAGAQVTGVVTNSIQGTHDTRPQMDLAVQRVDVNGASRTVRADTPAIVAGSNRAKKLGVIAGGAAVGALVGHAVGGNTKGTVIGGVLGGAASYGLTRHALRTMQLKPGTVITFTTREDVVARRY